MTKENLNELTKDIKENVFLNPDMIFNFDGENTVDLLEIIASLHNVLYKEVTGEYYDYMFHWFNKTAGGSIDDDLYKKYEEG